VPFIKSVSVIKVMVERGRPLRRVSTGKKVSVPNFSFIGPDAAAEAAFDKPLLESVISSFDSGR
jgi:hypothetical protein